MNPHRTVVTLANNIPSPLAAKFRTSSIAARILRPLVNRLMPRYPVPIVIRSGPATGINILVYPKDEKYYWTGLHEESVQQMLCSILRPGMVFWDIGAHIGFFSLLASRLVGDDGCVHSFEPLPDNAARLATGVRLNSASNVVIHQKAVMDRSGEVTLYAHKSSLMWTVVPQRGEETGVPVACVTLDEIHQFAPTPDLVKVDVEGAEVETLIGGRALISAGKSKILVEFSTESQVKHVGELFPHLRIDRIDAQHWLLTP